MKIKILEELLPDDIKEINEQFFYEHPLEDTYGLTIATEHLQTMGELEWIMSWIDIGYILSWNNSVIMYTLQK